VPLERHFSASCVEEALDVLGRRGPEVLICAGGTDVMVALRAGALPPEKRVLLDVSRIAALSGVRELDGGAEIEVGSLTTHALASQDAVLARSSIILPRACRSVGSPQVRNRGTVGGNVLTAAQCADTIPALLSLNASAVLAAPGGRERIVPLADFFPAPKRSAIEADELLTALRFPSLGPRWRGSFYKLIRRAAVAKARLSFAFLARLSPDGVVEDARLSIGAALPVPARFEAAEALLRGSAPSAELVEDAAEACAAQMAAATGKRWSSPYKNPVLRAVARRELAAMLGLEAPHENGF